MADFSITGEVRLNSDPAEKSTSKWTVAAGNMIADFAKKAASELGKVVQSGVDYNASMESYLTNFKVMLGNEELAAAKLSELRKMAASTPFALSDLTEGTQILLQFGIAADDTTDVLKQLGDISLGNADKLQTLVRAYGKMSSAKKVTLENVNMMIDAGFNPLNQICEATGESMSDLYKRISDGRVSFEELQYAVQAATSEGGQFYNGMLEASRPDWRADQRAVCGAGRPCGEAQRRGHLLPRQRREDGPAQGHHRHCYVGGRGGGRSVPGLQGVCGACHGCRGRAHRCHHGHDRSQRCR